MRFQARRLPATAWIGLLLTVLPAAVMAQTVYITDTLYIGLRAGKADDAATIKTLKTGVQLELLSPSEGEFSHVRTPQGDEGWIRNRYLSQQPVAQLKLAQTEDKLARVIAENGQLKLDILEARRRVDETEKELSRLSAETPRLAPGTEPDQVVAAPAPAPIDNTAELAKLRTENAELVRQLSEVRPARDAARDSVNRDWFAVGGAVALAGLLVGLVVPNMGLRRRRSQWES